MNDNASNLRGRHGAARALTVGRWLAALMLLAVAFAADGVANAACCKQRHQSPVAVSAARATVTAPVTTPPPAAAAASPASATTAVVPAALPGTSITASPAVAYAKDPTAIRRGRLIFIGTCGAYCHALHGGTRGDVPDLFDCEWRHGGLDADIFHTIATGVPGTRMVGFKDAFPDKETDVWKVVAFLRANSNCKTP